MADDGTQEANEKTGLLAVLPDFRRLEPILQRLPVFRANLGKIAERIFGSPARTRSMAGAEATAGVGREVADARAMMIRAAAEREASKITDGADPELALRALDRIGENCVRAQMNLEQTMARVCEHVTPMLERGDATGEIDYDWLDQWTRIAETKSKEEIQDLLARILAGEAHSPGSFSPSTLQVLAIVTPELAQKFERFCNMSTRGLDTVTMVLWLTESSVGAEFVPFGLTYDDLLVLQSAGLLSAIGATSFSFQDGISKVSFDYAGQRASLTSQSGPLKGQHSNIVFSTAGDELRSLIALAPIPEFTAKIQEYAESYDMTFEIYETNG